MSYFPLICFILSAFFFGVWVGLNIGTRQGIRIGYLDRNIEENERKIAEIDQQIETSEKKMLEIMGPMGN